MRLEEWAHDLGIEEHMETMSAIEELDRRFGIPGVVRICEGTGGLPRIHRHKLRLIKSRSYG